MKSAIEVLNTEALRIVIIVDDDERLVGTVTDGDIRRGLINHLTMDSTIKEFMYTDPTVAYEEDSRESILDKMKKLNIFQIPIIDANRKVVGLETLQHLLEKARYDNAVFLMAGGFGKRLRPLTDNLPKPLLRIGEKPILETILEQFITTGFHNFYISTHYKAELVKKHFGDGSKWDVSIKYIYEDKPLGTAGALGLLPKDAVDLPLIMMNGDLLTKIDFEKLLKFHVKQGGDATMCVRAYDFQVPYGVIKADGNRITNIIEKPIYKFFVNAGIYVLGKSIIESVDGKTYLDMPNMLESKIEQGGKVNMFPVHEYWLDIGRMEQFEQAQRDNETEFN